MGFFLFLLATLVLYVRPNEIFTELEGLPIYLVLIVGSCALSYCDVMEEVSWSNLAKRPISLCVLGLLIAIILSHLVRLNLYEARVWGIRFFKVIAFFFLLIGHITSQERMRVYLLTLLLGIVVLTTLALLQFHEYIHVPSLTVLEQNHFDQETGQYTVFTRLRSTGIFNDPNDLCLILSVGIFISLYLAGDRNLGSYRIVCLILPVLFGYALALTRSRGGFIGINAGMLILLRAKLGTYKTLALACVVMPPMLVLFAGRMTNLEIQGGTGQERIRLWSEALGFLRQSPVFGMGAGQFVEEAGLVAHNSFVHAFAELGFFGGTLFVGAFFVAIFGLEKLPTLEAVISNEHTRRLRPYLMAVAGSYAAGMLSLSRCYTIPTYMVLGLTAAYFRITTAETGLPLLQCDARLTRTLGYVGITFVVSTYLFVRIFARWST